MEETKHIKIGTVEKIGERYRNKHTISSIRGYSCIDRSCRRIKWV